MFWEYNKIYTMEEQWNDDRYLEDLNFSRGSSSLKLFSIPAATKNTNYEAAVYAFCPTIPSMLFISFGNLI
jgi:hypothetical protein